jgi:putative SOS response-associated peptidase YedK
MCGRYLIVTTPDAMRKLFGYAEVPNFPARYNVAPTQPVPIVRVAEGRREFALVRWGLIPAWVKDPREFALVINARGESVNEKPAFRNAMKRRRCLVPADGFYEWKTENGRKRAHVIRPRDGATLALAGLWESWMGPNGEEVETVAIVTTLASADVAHIHHRMPVIVPRDAFGFWLDGVNVDAATAAEIIAPAPEGLLESYGVSDAVNRVVNDGPELIAPAPPEAEFGPSVAMDAAAPRRGRVVKKDDRQASLF